MLDKETYLECSRKNAISTREDQEETQKPLQFESTNQFDDNYSQRDANDVFDTPQMSPHVPKELLHNNNNAKDICECVFQNEKRM